MKKLVFLLFISVQLFAQKPLPRSSPEAEGVSSQNINQFIDAIQQSKHELHSFMMLRHGKVVAEAWNHPYKPELKHTLYSCSKSFTATAIGFAVAEKKLTVLDKVISFFPDKVPAKISDHLAALTIKDLLTMSVGHDKEPIGPIISQEDDWVKGFLAAPIQHAPGTRFLYNSIATYMLSAIVQKVTRLTLIDYLTPRLFTPLGITGMDWETDPMGIQVGGWGLRLKTEDMAKFGQLFLQKGMWQGKQIIPSSWIEEATTVKIMQDPSASQGRKDSSDWLQGYCYQMWRSRHNSYRGDGANGQYILVFPELDAVIAVTSEAPDMQGEFNLIWQYLYTALQPKKLKANPAALAMLRSKSASMAIPLPRNMSSTMESKVSGNTYGITSTHRGLSSLSLNFAAGICSVTLHTDSVTHTIPFGNGQWVSSSTTKFGPYLVAGGKNNRVGIGPFKVMGAYAWKEENKLDLTLRYVESPHTEIMHLTFMGERINMETEHIFNRNAVRPVIKGIAKAPVANAPRLIVRGDDMGFSHSANEALIKCYTEGIETSIEVIVPSPWFPEAVKLLALHPGIDVGLHFAITAEWDNIKWRPLTDCPSLKDPDGYFYQMLYPNAYYPKGALMDHAWKLADIEQELRAQIAMARKYIPRLSHVSGHMNSLAFAPEVREMVARLSKELDLPMVDRDPGQDIKTNYIGFDFKNKTTQERIDGFIAMLDKMEAGKTYVYVEHPGLDTDELKAIHHRGYEDVAQGRQDVTNIFTSEKVKEAVHQKGIKLVSYKEVIAGMK